MSSLDASRPRTVAALAAGVLFGLGLAISGMTNPEKVANFLDVSGAWDPSLLLVMAGAVGVTFAGYRLARRRTRPFFDMQFHLARHSALDRPLLAGAFIFGIGWGLAGFCPGPAVTALAWGSPDAAIFVVAMAAGMALMGARRVRASTPPPRRAAPPARRRRRDPNA